MVESKQGVAYLERSRQLIRLKKRAEDALLDLRAEERDAETSVRQDVSGRSGERRPGIAAVVAPTSPRPGGPMVAAGGFAEQRPQMSATRESLTLDIISRLATVTANVPQPRRTRE